MSMNIKNQEIISKYKNAIKHSKIKKTNFKTNDMFKNASKINHFKNIDNTTEDWRNRNLKTPENKQNAIKPLTTNSKSRNKKNIGNIETFLRRNYGLIQSPRLEDMMDANLNFSIKIIQNKRPMSALRAYRTHNDHFNEFSNSYAPKLTELQLIECGIETNTILKSIIKCMKFECNNLKLASNKETFKVKELNKIKKANQQNRVKLNSNSSYHSCIIESEEISKKIELFLAKIPQWFEPEPDTDAYMLDREEVNQDNEDIFGLIKDSSKLQTDTNVLIKCIDKILHDLKNSKMFDSLNFEQKLCIKKQIKCFELIIDNIKDIKILINCIHSKACKSEDQMVDIINLLKIDCKYGIKEKIYEIELSKEKSNIKRTNDSIEVKKESVIGKTLKIESKLINQQKKKVRKYLQLISKNTQDAMTPKEHLAYITNALEKSKILMNTNESNKNIRVKSARSKDIENSERLLINRALNNDKKYIPKSDLYGSPNKQRQRK